MDACPRPAKKLKSAYFPWRYFCLAVASLLASPAETTVAGIAGMPPVSITAFDQTSDCAQEVQEAYVNEARPIRVLADNDGLTIWVKLLNGEMRSVRANQIWRLRPSVSHDEPEGATVLDFAFERLFVANSVEDIAEKIGGMRRLARFTMPNGQPVYLVASKVIETFKAIRGQHHPEANTVVGTREGTQQVRETQERAIEIITSAKGS